MLSGAATFYTVLTWVRDACVTQFSSLGDPLKRVTIVPGAIAWDACDTCGLLALSQTRTFFSDDPMNESPMVHPQGEYICADMVVQAIRCAPTLDDNGNPPSVSLLDKSAQEVMTDAFTIMCTTDATLALHAGVDFDFYLMRQQIFVGPEGACVGSELSFTVGLIR